MSVLDDMRLWISEFELTLEWVKTFETIWMEWMYFGWAKGMDFRRSEMENATDPKWYLSMPWFISWDIIPSVSFEVGPLERIRSWEWKTLINGIIALMNEVRESSSLLPSRTWRWPPMNREAGSHSCDTEFTSTLTLDFQASRMPPSLWQKRWIK